MLVYFSVFNIHQTLTWTIGSVTCACDLLACVYTRGTSGLVSSEGLLYLPVPVAESVCPCAATCVCLLCVISGSVLHVLSMEQRDCYGDTSALYLRVPLVHNYKRDASCPLSTPDEYNSQIMLMLLLLFIKTKIPLYFVKKGEKSATTFEDPYFCNGR